MSGSALVGAPVGTLTCLDIEVIEDLDVIGQEPDRREDDVLPSPARELPEHRLEVRPEPRDALEATLRRVAPVLTA